MKNKSFVYLFIGLVVVYVALAMILPSDPKILDKYHITQLHARMVNLSIVVPIVLVWLTALYGYVRFKAYALLVSASAEGPALNKLANGLMILAYSLPITSILSSSFTYWTSQRPDLLPNTTIIRNYVGLLFSLAAFVVISLGAKSLLNTANRRAIDPHSSLPNLTAPVLIVLSCVFTWLIVARPLNGVVGQKTYYLPEWLIVCSLAIPYLYAWYKGLLAAYRLYLYRAKVKGSVYKQSFEYLAKGVGVVVFTSIFIQFITTLSARLNRLNLTPVLLVIYLLVIFYAIGFGLVARGAKKLKKIEEA